MATPSPPKPWERNPQGTPSSVVTGGAEGDATAAAAAAADPKTTAAASGATTNTTSGLGTSGFGMSGSYGMGSRYGMGGYGMSSGYGMGSGYGMSSYGMGGYGMGMGMMGGGMGMMGMPGQMGPNEQKAQMVIMMMQGMAQNTMQFSSMVNMALQNIVGAISQHASLHQQYSRNGQTPAIQQQPQQGNAGLLDLNKKDGGMQTPAQQTLTQSQQISGAAPLPSTNTDEQVAHRENGDTTLRRIYKWATKALLLLFLYQVSRVLATRIEQILTRLVSPTDAAAIGGKAAAMAYPVPPPQPYYGNIQAAPQGTTGAWPTSL